MTAAITKYSTYARAEWLRWLEHRPEQHVPRFWVWSSYWRATNRSFALTSMFLFLPPSLPFSPSLSKINKHIPEWGFNKQNKTKQNIPCIASSLENEGGYLLTAIHRGQHLHGICCRRRIRKQNEHLEDTHLPRKCTHDFISPVAFTRGFPLPSWSTTSPLGAAFPVSGQRK